MPNIDITELPDVDPDPSDKVMVIQADADLGLIPSLQSITGTDLGWDADNNQVTSSTGDNATVPDVTGSADGLMTSGDKTKLDGIASGAEANVPTDLFWDAENHTVTSSTGNGTVIPIVDAVFPGLISSADWQQINAQAGLPAAGTTGQILAKASNLDYEAVWVDDESGGTGTNLTWDASTRTMSSSSGTNATIDLVGVNDGLLTSADKTKLDGIAPGAEANVATDLAWNASTSAVTSSTGTDATLTAADATNPGLMGITDFNKILQVTQAAYDGLTPDATTLYVIVG